MARCQFQRFVGRSVETATWETCGRQATHIGKMPFATKAEYRCEEHAGELASKMPLMGSVTKAQRTLSDAQEAHGGTETPGST